MVTFSCEVCNETVPKKNTEKHYWRCPDAVYTCIDCSKTFHDGVGYKSHTQCISEDEKYQKGLYKGKNKNNKKGNTNTNGKESKGKSNQLRSDQANGKVETAQKSKTMETKTKTKTETETAKKITKNKSLYDHKSLLKEGTSLYEILKSLKSKKDEKKHFLKSLVVNSSGKIVLSDKS